MPNRQTGALRHRPFNYYDALKLLALLTMLIDHIGWYLLPEMQWMRAIGRCSMPIWLFLAGLGSLHLPHRLFIAAAGIALLTWLCEYDAWPLNILVSIIMARALLRWVDVYFPNLLKETPIMSYLILAIFGSIGFLVWDYGPFALAFAAYGYCWHRKIGSRRLHLLYIMTWLLYLFFAQTVFSFNEPNGYLMLLCCSVVAPLLYGFTLQPLPHIPAKLALVGSWLSRNSLYLYVGHLVLLMPLGALLR